MRRKEFQKLLNRYKQGLCTPEEESLLEAWFRSMGSRDQPAVPAAEKARIKQRSWARIQTHIADAKKEEVEVHVHSPAIRLNSRPSLAIAASLLIAVACAVFLLVHSPRETSRNAIAHAANKTISNNTASVMEVHLTDGSNVLLKPASSIRFKEPFDDGQRLVSLEGEAFFRVARDTLRPFLVSTNEVTTKVLGTRFSVTAFPNEDNITVSVVSGRVSVITKKDDKAHSNRLQETILTPNQKIVYDRNRNTVSRTIVEAPQPILPADVVKRMQFDAAPVKQVFHGLEQVYGVDIEFDEHVFSSCILTTSIGGGNIYKRLDVICKAIDARYFLRENRIIITGKGCGQHGQ